MLCVRNMLEDIAAFPSRFDQDRKSFADLHLPGEFAKHRRPQRNLEGGIGFERLQRDGIHPSFFVRINSVPRLFIT